LSWLLACCSLSFSSYYWCINRVARERRFEWSLNFMWNSNASLASS
jgi:hypothetical protein